MSGLSEPWKPKPENKIVFTVRLSRNDHAALVRATHDEYLTLSDLVRAIIREWLESR